MVALPRAVRTADAGTTVAGIGDWVDSAPLRDLVACFGGRWPTGDLGAVLAGLDEFSARHWDFRAGRERPDAREPDLDPVTAGRARAAAIALGMVRPLPPARPGTPTWWCSAGWRTPACAGSRTRRTCCAVACG